MNTLTQEMLLKASSQWFQICTMSDLIEDSGVCALLPFIKTDTQNQIAIFYVNNEVYATSNWDPVGKAQVIYRGIIGSTNGELYICSPLYKQKYSLKTGICLDDNELYIPVYKCKVDQEKIHILIDASNLEVTQ